MNLSGLHILLTYRCTLACDHCFVWGSPWQDGTLSLGDVRRILNEGKTINSINSIYFEGGEVFLYYATLVKSVQIAFDMGFNVGIVSNGYWATTVEDAKVWLEPFVGLLSDLSISDDLYHAGEMNAQHVQNARTAADELGIPLGTITVAQPEAVNVREAVGQLPFGESTIMYRGRAAMNLVSRAQKRPFSTFTRCPYENLRDPGRVHVDPFGYLHICQGISIGNIFNTPLKEILSQINPDTHPIVGPLLKGGPALLARQYHTSPDQLYADACHFCFQTRLSLRDRFPNELTPDQMYSEPD